jgi:hypothetical protein
MIRDARTIFRSSLKAAGLLLVLTLLPSAARADCNHASGYGDYGGYVPVSHHAKHDTEKPEDRKPARPQTCQGCFNCGQHPANAPSSTTTGFEILDLLATSATGAECDPHSAYAQYSPQLTIQQPVFAIEHPPRAFASSL